MGLRPSGIYLWHSDMAVTIPTNARYVIKLPYQPRQVLGEEPPGKPQNWLHRMDLDVIYSDRHSHTNMVIS